MPRRNRVLPTGEIVALPQRGTLMGNRGVLHDTDGRLGRRRWAHQNWVACTLSFKGIRRQIMMPHRYTELFFWDEAVALAAGHRPCALCRRARYTEFLDAWQNATGNRPSAPDIDRALHAARLEGPSHKRVQRRHLASYSDLPTGSFVIEDGTAMLVTEDALRPHGPDGYGAPRPRPKHGEAEVLTPAPILAVLRAGYWPALHPSIG